jgi:hypothetical protein
LNCLPPNRRKLSGDDVVAFLGGGLLHFDPAFDLRSRLKPISVINASVITNQKSEDGATIVFGQRDPWHYIPNGRERKPMRLF